MKMLVIVAFWTLPAALGQNMPFITISQNVSTDGEEEAREQNEKRPVERPVLGAVRKTEAVL